MKSGGDFNRVKIFALDVLNERKFKQTVAVDGADQRRNFGQASQARRTPAALARNDAISILSVSIDHDGLQHAMDADRLRKLVDLVAIEDVARLLFARLNLVEGYIVELFEIFGQRRLGQRGGPAVAVGVWGSVVGAGRWGKRAESPLPSTLRGFRSGSFCISQNFLC